MTGVHHEPLRRSKGRRGARAWQQPGGACVAEGKGNRLEVGDDKRGSPVGDRSERERRVADRARES